MALPYDYVFPSGFAPAPQATTLSYRQARFLLSVLTPFKDGVRWYDTAGDDVTLTDNEQAEIDAVWDKLNRLLQ